VNEILFLRAASALPRTTIMGMQMRRAIRHGILQGHVTLKPLVEIPRLGNVDGRPIPVRQLFGINVNAGQRSKGCGKRMNLELIRLAGLPGPIVGGGRCTIRRCVATE